MEALGFPGKVSTVQCQALCLKCANLFENWPPHNTLLTEDPNESAAIFPHHGDQLSLQRSAEQGCVLCAQFMRVCRLAERPFWLRRQDKLTPDNGCVVVASTGFGRGWFHLCQTVVVGLLGEAYDISDEPSSSTSRRWLNYQLNFCAREPFSNMYNLQKYSTNTQDALSLAKKWLFTCATEHKVCSSHRTTGSVPTRLIDITGNQTRLCIGAEIGTRRYATLSHCWGKIPFITLTKSNFKEFMHSIPFHILPKTFRDAIEIARSLGLEYIWIDSLCIIQDDNDDWKQQSSLMCSVYRGTSINIAASAARDGRSGCFLNRPLSWRSQIEIIDRNSGSKILWDIIHPQFEERLTQMPLFSRGWVVQERILAPRTLHFTTLEVFWECYDLQACETFPEGFPSPTSSLQVAVPKKQSLIMELWNEIIQQYSKCDITFEKDKLIAISGLARLLHEETREYYFAGLWRSDMEAQLCWIPAISSVRVSRPVAYRAPTWSWASLDGEICRGCPDSDFLLPKHRHSCIYIQDIHIRNVLPGNPFSEVLSGRLRLRCEYLMSGRYSYHGAQTQGLRLDGVSLNCNHFTPESFKKFELDSHFEFPETQDLPANREVRISSAEDLSYLPKVYFLPIFLYDDWTSSYGTEGLILKATGASRG